MGNKYKIIIISVLLLGVSFYGGKQYGQSVNTASLTNATSQRSNFVRNTNGASARVGAMRGANGGFTTGEVISKDDTSIVVKLKDGGSKIIFVSNSTSVAKTESGTLADVSVGKQVSVTGSSNSDGSVTAESIQIRPLSNNK
jgi:hypothetical protein